MASSSILQLLIGSACLFYLASADLSTTPHQRRRRLGKTSAKRSKSKKDSKNNSLIAFVQKLESYNGDLNPLGTSTIRFNDNGGFLFSNALNGLDTNCVDDGTKCGIYIADGVSCDDYSAPLVATDDGSSGIEWSVENGAWYTTIGQGISYSAFKFDNGYGFDGNNGKVVIVNDASDTAIGCGVLAPEVSKKKLRATMGPYPGYTGDLNASGKVTVEFYPDKSFSFNYKLSGLAPNCVDCGIHIHAGVSCDTADQVLGHGWNALVVQDLWVTAGGATYDTDEKGEVESGFNLFNGYGYEANYHHAVVIHTQDGSRVGCGVLL